MGNFFSVTTDWTLRGDRKPRVIYLCEGESETEYVDTWLTDRRENNNNIWIYCFRGLSQIDAKINILIKEPNFKYVNTVCIFLDAEDNFEQRKRDVCRMLRRMDFPSTNVNNTPWVETNNGKKSCVFISPDMNSTGRIENIVLNEIRTKVGVFDCLEEYRQCVLRSGISSFDEKKIVNSYIITNQVGISLGAAFKRKIFDLNHNAYRDVNNLLEQALS